MSDEENIDEDVGYTVEKHGDDYVLYYGRSATKHGFNVCTLSDWDENWDITNLALLMNLGRERLMRAAEEGVYL